MASFSRTVTRQPFIPRDLVSSPSSGSVAQESQGGVQGAGVEFKVCAKTPIISNYQNNFVYDETKS